MGLGKKDVMDALVAAFHDVKQQTKDAAVLKVKTQGVEKTINQVEGLSDAIKKCTDLFADKRNNVGMAKYFGS